MTTTPLIYFDNGSINKILVGFIGNNFLGEKKENLGKKPIKISAIDKIHLSCNCINCSKVIESREPILFNFPLNAARGYETYWDPKTTL